MTARASAAYDLVLNNKSGAGRKAFLNSLDTVDNKVAALAVGGFAALGVAGVAAFTAMYNAQAPLIDQLGKTSETLQINVVSLQAMEDAASRAGVGTQELAGSLQEGLKRISEAAAGAGPAGEVLDKIGLSAKDLQAIAPEERIYEILRALEGVEDAGNRIEYADKIFGGSGIGLIRITADAISDAEKEMRDLGIALQEVDVENVERLNDELQRVERNVSQGSKVFVSAMAPAIIAVMETMFNLGDTTVNVRESFTGMADTVVSVVGFVGDQVNNIRRFIKGLEFTFQDLGTNIFRLLDKLPGLDFGDQIKEEFDKGIKIYSDYLAIDENGKFSERLKDNLKQVRIDAEAAALAVRNAQTAVVFPDVDGVGGGDGTSAAKAEEEKFKQIEKDAATLQRIRDFTATEEELLIERAQRTQNILDNIALRDVDRVGEVNELKQAANQEYHDKYLQLLERRNSETDKREKAQSTASRSYIEKGIEHFAQKSDVADALHKALVARRMFREGKEAVIGAYKWGNSIGGPLFGAAAAGVAIVYTGALIAEAVGGGGSTAAPPSGDVTAPDTSNGTTADSSSTGDQPQQVVNVTYYSRRGQSSSAAEAEARQYLAEDIANKTIVVGDNLDVRVNVFDYEDYGT